MAVRIQRGNSRLVHAELVRVDGVEFWTRPNIPELPASPNDVSHKVESGQRIEQIADMYYGKQEWWWVIVHRNNLGLVPDSLIVGQRIIIPDAALIRSTLFTK